MQKQGGVQLSRIQIVGLSSIQMAKTLTLLPSADDCVVMFGEVASILCA